MLQTPKGLRLHIGLFGLRNAGKSSLVNALTNQMISIVSHVPGTTTDPVEKAYELQPVGPVVFVDTAGIDDVGELGLARVQRTLQVLEWVDLALIVVQSKPQLSQQEKQLLEDCQRLATPVVIAVTHVDELACPDSLKQELEQFPFPRVETRTDQPQSIDSLRHTLVSLINASREPDRLMLEGLVNTGDTVMLVTPIDIGAPKGRLILPQVQAIRELLDMGVKCLVVQCNEVTNMLEQLKTPPQLVITDSQVVLEVARQVPESIPLTTFSIQLAASKSDSIAMAEGAAQLEQLRDGDRVLILETCSHHPQKDDIGRVKIPRWLKEKTGKNLTIEIAVGKDIPDDFTPYKLLIQCGGCIVTRRHMLARLRQAQRQGVPMTNYGMTISFLQGLLGRVLRCHPAALEAYQTKRLVREEAC